MAGGVKGVIFDRVVPDQVSPGAVVIVQPAVRQVEAVFGNLGSGGVGNPLLRAAGDGVLVSGGGLAHVVVIPAGGGHVHVEAGWFWSI